MNQELEILDNGPQQTGGSKALQVTLFVFACLGFLLKLVYSVTMYGQMSKLNGLYSTGETGEMFRLIKLVCIGVFFHSLFLFTGALLLLLRRKFGIWFYLFAQLLLFASLFLMWTRTNGSSRIAKVELIFAAIYFLIPVLFIVLNLVNRRYWRNRKLP